MKTTAEMILVKRMAKYRQQDCRTNEDILSELNINPVLQKIQNDINKLTQHVRRMDRHTDWLPHLDMKYQPCRKGSQDNS
jgi:hypothetical protein